MNNALAVTIDYTNWRGERGVRRIEPRHIEFTSSEFHPEQQWLLTAWDIDKGAFRTFAMKDIHSWSTAS
jgi:predicted DNA-binding transcriptional regulator YafY